MNRLKVILKDKKMTYQDLADALGISQSAVKQIINGNPSETTLKKIADILDVPMWQLYIAPEEISNENSGLKCPHCGKELEFIIKEK